ncbi:MAG TPA: prenyltransferase/squalene oxidase repeat-containing protein [Verrucomicrobiae bacterium]|nr:prenyltransferase/squalene oxidase repeat-containing protein [Verrucomicrobiae bacterium]
MSIENLISKQNRDGGWAYVRGGSWTEPTIYAMLALSSAGESIAVRRGADWLRSIARPDGGWPPRAGVDESTWVTALVGLLPPETIGEAFHRKAIDWLMDTTGEESSAIYRLRQWLLGNPTPASDRDYPGWPWIPGTAGWVGPTSFAILALEKEDHRRASRKVRHRIEGARQFLLRRTCEGGGWNHGSSRPLGYPSRAYPETTGLALAALRGVRSPEVSQGIAMAKGFLADCRSADALNWLRLGLRAHGELPPGFCTPTDVEYRTTQDQSLDLVMTAGEQGQEYFWG